MLSDSESLQPENKKSEPEEINNKNNQFGNLLESRFSYKPNDNRFSLFNRVTRGPEPKEEDSVSLKELAFKKMEASKRFRDSLDFLR